jgi:TonB family protein
METTKASDSASTGTEQEPNFLLVRDTSGDWPRWKRAAVGSTVFHVVGITALFLIHGSSYQPPPPENLRHQEVIHLFVPKDLTQKAPNKEPVAKLMMSEPSAPTPKLTEPKPQTTKAFTPPPPVPKSAPPPPVIQPPTPVAPPAPTPGEMAKNQIPSGSLPPAQAPKPDAPKIVVDDSPSLHPQPKFGGGLQPPNPIAEANRTYGNMPAGNKPGDSGEISVGGGLHLPASAARLSNFQLRSDPMGVDFQPYLQQVLAAVKLNWLAVFPEAARLGQRGTVTIEFGIGKDGTVEKIVFNGQSGSRALDNASVAAISASNRLPPLPKDYKGDRIAVDITFMYNIPR